MGISLGTRLILSPTIRSRFHLFLDSETVGCGCAVLSGCRFYLFGGKDPLRGSVRRVVFYNARMNKWQRGPDMLRKRHLFGSCVINNCCLYVAGGECEGIQRTLRSAEVYDPNKNRWSFVADMSTAVVPFIGVVYDKKWFLKGQVMSEAFDHETNSWSLVLVMGWLLAGETRVLCLDGHLYGLDCRDGCKLRVFDESTDSWNKFMDRLYKAYCSTGQEPSFKRPRVPQVNLRNNMSMSLVDVLNPDKNSPRLWENIAVKGQSKSVLGNMWSSIL